MGAETGGATAIGAEAAAGGLGGMPKVAEGAEAPGIPFELGTAMGGLGGTPPAEAEGTGGTAVAAGAGAGETIGGLGGIVADGAKGMLVPEIGVGPAAGIEEAIGGLGAIPMLVGGAAVVAGASPPAMGIGGLGTIDIGAGTYGVLAADGPPGCATPDMGGLGIVTEGVAGIPAVVPAFGTEVVLIDAAEMGGA